MTRSLYSGCRWVNQLHTWIQINRWQFIIKDPVTLIPLHIDVFVHSFKRNDKLSFIAIIAYNYNNDIITQVVDEWTNYTPGHIRNYNYTVHKSWSQCFSSQLLEWNEQTRQGDTRNFYVALRCTGGTIWFWCAVTLENWNDLVQPSTASHASKWVEGKEYPLPMWDRGPWQPGLHGKEEQLSER